ncbi:MAG: anhydro-N-acetylmuramic acid kinase [Flavobacteriaceae bacterium]|nr:anhydro-N-acetylmuramic acid kinase [Flavobacteriaceae bacterium]
MKKEHFYVIGVMSGTSLDGLDLALVEFNLIKGKWTYRYVSTTTTPYPDSWQKQLENARFLEAEALAILNRDYTTYLAEQIKLFIAQNPSYTIDLVCSHGHTVHHKPDQGITFQIGNQRELSSYLKITVVCDFRVQDVAFGGQGAPLVPGGEFHLFSDYAACVNLGGFANISLLKQEHLIAFDVAAANLVFNTFAQKLNLPYDADGKIAAQGHLIPDLLQELNSLAYYSLAFPKSLGVEWITEQLTPIFVTYQQERVADLMHTYSVHLATQLLNVLPTSGKILFTGGGTHNLFLMQQIQKTSTAEICIPSDLMIDYKEAMIFGFLGLLKYCRVDNCFASVTGARHNHSTGVIFEHN